MLKETVNYTDFNDNPKSKDLWFNISKTELLENMDLQEEFEGLQSIASGEKRDVTPAEIRKILELVKRVIRLAYGERSADGERFDKNPALWEEFQQTAAYDAFLFSLFTDTEGKAVKFLTGIMPSDLRAEAQKMAAQQNPDIYSDGQTIRGETDDRPTWEKEDRDPTSQELQTATPQQIQRAFARKNSR